jgi:predicted GIY-YIG superfamily endonuclease
VPTPPTYLYTVTDAAGQYLYVGISLNVAQRMCEHRHGAKWWGEHTNIITERYPDRTAALAAEKEAISKFKPKYNVVGNGKAKAVNGTVLQTAERAQHEIN